MKVTYTLDDIKEGLNSWTQLVTPVVINKAYWLNQKLILQYLNQGFCIQITRADFERWSADKPERIHAYPAILDGVLKFVLIDSVSDQKEQTNTDNLVVKDFHCGETNKLDLAYTINYSNPSLKLQEAMRRNLMWNLYCKLWMNLHVITKTPVFQVISIPYEDYKNVFAPPPPSALGDIKTQEQYAIAFLGLTNQSGDGPFDIEFILTNETTDYQLPHTLYDISRPVPPFGALGPESFRLLPVVS